MMNQKLIFKELHVVIESVKFIIANMSMKNHIESIYRHFKIDQQQQITVNNLGKLNKYTTKNCEGT
jgi:hypothetical protein